MWMPTASISQADEHGTGQCAQTAGTVSAYKDRLKGRSYQKLPPFSHQNGSNDRTFIQAGHPCRTNPTIYPGRSF